MYQEEFLPVVFTVQFTVDQALPIEKWRSQINDLLHVYVDQVSKNKDRIIGHIKALAQINDTEFIKYSCISNANVINSKFCGEHQDVFKINMIVNSLVSNISADESRVLFERSCKVMRNQSVIICFEIKSNHPKSEHHHHKAGDDCPICNGHQHG
nr:hypothetical protein [uncultured Acetobacterium sp.]